MTIYDKGPGAHDAPTPIGMLWIRLNDVVDELRREKVGAEAGAGWVTAAGVEGGTTPPASGVQGHQPSGSIGGALDMPVPSTLPPNAQSAALRPGTLSAVDGIDSWFTVEPAGQIDLHLNFSKLTLRLEDVLMSLMCRVETDLSAVAALLILSQSNRMYARDHTTQQVSVVKVPSASAKRRYTNRTATSSCKGSSTESFFVLSVRNSYSKLLACSVKTVDLLATRSATIRWSLSVSAKPKLSR